MTLTAILLGILCQLCVVSGQLLFKHAMGPAKPHGIHRTFALLALGILTQSLWFFLWSGLLEKWDLSRLYVFEGLNPAMLALAAWVVLKERLALTSWVGLGMICVGVAIVSGK